MSQRRLRFVNTRSDVGGFEPSVDHVVLDTWWAPPREERPDVRWVLPVVQRVLAEADLVGASIARLDAWAERANLPDRLVAEGATWWFRVRMAIRWDLHELMVWNAVLADLAPDGRYDAIEVPASRTALLAVAEARAAHMVSGAGQGGRRPQVKAVGWRGGRPTLRRWLGSLLGLPWIRRLGLGLLALIPAQRRRTRVLDRRVRSLVNGPPQVMALAWAKAFQVVRAGGDDRRMDPHLEIVLDRLQADGSRVAMLVRGLSHRRHGDWPTILSDNRIIPETFTDRWRPANDLDGRGGAPVRAGLSGIPLEVEGADLGPPMARLVDAYAGSWLCNERRASARAEAFLRAVRPKVLYLDREGTRTAWMHAARRRGIPIVAVQHGMIHRVNPEYCHAAHPLDVRPDVTCVFGTEERDILVRLGGYQPDAVRVTGSPRVSPREARAAVRTRAEREAVRGELGVTAGTRLLVVSTAHNAVLGDLYGAAMFTRLLGGELSGIHIVVKIHPQDPNPGGYERLLEALAAAGGYAPPPVTTVRDIDLYRLLHAADAHLSQYSTVLTDAVVAGTPNMVSVWQAFADPIDYVAARVAVPVASIDDVRAFMADPRPPAEEDRANFLAHHFEPGDAAGRIAGILRGMSGEHRSGDLT